MCNLLEVQAAPAGKEFVPSMFLSALRHLLGGLSDARCSTDRQERIIPVPNRFAEGGSKEMSSQFYKALRC